MNSCNVIDAELAKILFPKRKDESNKGTYGKVLNFAGCKEYVGAAYLSSISALKVGAGYVELASPNCVKDSISCRTSDIVFVDMNSHSYLENFPRHIDLDKYSVISVGCGLGNNKSTQKFIRKLIDIVKDVNIPAIFDADALNIIASEGIVDIGSRSLITPHPGEMARLMGVDVSEVQFNRNDYIRLAAQKYNSAVILKGHNTLVACPDGKVFEDILGTNVLAKAGMGDVLTGIISGLVAQGLNVRQAAVLGVYLHSQAGVCGAKVHTEYGLLASELVDFIPEGIKSVLF